MAEAESQDLSIRKNLFVFAIVFQERELEKKWESDLWLKGKYKEVSESIYVLDKPMRVLDIYNKYIHGFSSSNSKNRG